MANRKDAKEAVAQLIQEFLDREGKKIDWLAKESGIHRQTVSRYLHQTTLPDRDNCLKLATTMKIAPELLLQAAGYFPADAVISSEASPIELEDPELKLYLSQIGAMPEKTREIIKTILRQEYHALLESKKAGGK